MDIRKRKESALKVVIALVAAVGIGLIIIGVSLLRDDSPTDISGARYVMSRDYNYHGEE